MGATDQVTTRGAIGTGMAHAANANLVAVVCAGRKLNRLLGGHAGTTAAAAIGARIGYDLA